MQHVVDAGPDGVSEVERLLYLRDETLGDASCVRHAVPRVRCCKSRG